MNTEKRKGERSRSRILIIVLLVILLLAVTGTVFAKYIASTKKTQEMESSNFHISSNYLKVPEEDASYNVVDWGNGFDIEIFNYETDNVALISDEEIEYKVEVSSGWIYNVNNDTKVSYKIPVSQNRESQTLHLAPLPGTESGELTVTVTTTSPYKKVLKAVFHTTSKGAPDYTVKKQTDGTILVTIGTNDYAGTISVKWNPEKFSPDNTDNRMAAWSNETNSGLALGTITAESNTTYELLFFTNETSFTDITNGKGTTITIQ